MEFKVELFPKRHLYNLFNDLIEKHNIVNFNSLKQELLRYKTESDHENYHINIEETDDICIFSTLPIFCNLRNTNDFVDKVSHQVKTCIVDKKTLLPLVYVDKHINYMDRGSYYSDSIGEIVSKSNYLNEKNKIKFYKNYIGEYIVLFYLCDKWMILNNNKIYNLKESSDMLPCLFCDLIMTKVNINLLDKNISYHFVMAHYRLNKCVLYPEWGNEYKELIFIKSEEKGTLEQSTDLVSDKLVKNSRLFFSCKDELLHYVDTLNDIDILNKKLTVRGILMIVLNETGESTCINFDTSLYNTIASNFVLNPNIHQTHLDLYQRDKCNDILPYITNNYTDIVRRINISIKTIAKEILNIYFLTRHKQHSELYEKLPKSYKDVLFNIHNIFMNKRDEDLEKAQKDDLMEKRSVTVDNVYSYLKGLSNASLVKIYNDRKNVIAYTNNSNIVLKTDQIMYANCINTIMQTQLMLT